MKGSAPSHSLYLAYAAWGQDAYYGHSLDSVLTPEFAANSLVDVTPRASLRLYYGSQDLDVVPEEALAAARSMRARGVDVQAIDVGAVGHDASMLAAAPLILAWLRELEESRSR